MKRLFVYITLIISVVTTYADNWIKDAEPGILEVRYKRIEVTDTLHRDSLFFKDEMILRIGKTKSLFCNVKQFFKDSLTLANPEAAWEMLKAEMDKGGPNAFTNLSGHKSSYLYKDYSDNAIIEEDYFDMTPWRYKEEWKKPEWNTTDESKEILGYECFKATTDYRGRRWTAWFAPEIPVQEGPWKLCGLPGLILEAYDTTRDYVFEACGLMNNSLGEVGFYRNRKSDDYFDVKRDQFFNNWWRYKHSDLVAKIRAAYGLNIKQTPNESTPKTVSYDKEETDYPHDL